jgi:hypothetical protein
VAERLRVLMKDWRRETKIEKFLKKNLEIKK